MAAADMMTVKYDLNIQPSKVPPTVRIKEGSTSVLLVFRLKVDNEDYPDDVIELETSGTAILKVTHDDGSTVFIAKAITSIDSDYITVEFTASEVAQLTAYPGTYYYSISVVDVAYSSAITQETYEDYDLITVQPFILEVLETAYGTENLLGTVYATATAILAEV